jgi:hypothetical protein
MAGGPFLVTLSSMLKPEITSFTPMSRDVRIGRSQKPGRLDIIVRCSQPPQPCSRPALAPTPHPHPSP